MTVHGSSQTQPILPPVLCQMRMFYGSNCSPSIISKSQCSLCRHKVYFCGRIPFPDPFALKPLPTLSLLGFPTMALLRTSRFAALEMSSRSLFWDTTHAYTRSSRMCRAPLKYRPMTFSRHLKPATPDLAPLLMLYNPISHRSSSLSLQTRAKCGLIPQRPVPGVCQSVIMHSGTIE